LNHKDHEDHKEHTPAFVVFVCFVVPKSILQPALRLGAIVAAAILLVPRMLSAQALTMEVPIVGGTAATARSLGIESVPERPRFLAELVRVIYDGREGKSAEVDAKLARLARHRDVTERFESALAAVQPRTGGISLVMASSKDDRGRLKDFLDLVGLKLREKNKTFTVERTDNKQAADRVRLLSGLGIDLARLATGLNARETVRIEVPAETIPVPLTAKLWSEAIFQKSVNDSEVFAAILSDRRAALLAHGLASLDDTTLGYLADHPVILTRVYDHGAAAFAAFADALRISDGRVVPPGGADGLRAWEAVLDEKVTRPEQFIHELFGAKQGRVALVYQTLAHLDPPHLRFALGSWMPDPAARVDQFKQLVTAEGARDEWDVDIRPFVRPVHDPSLLLARVRVTPTGAPARPIARLFWHRAFESADLPDDPARRLRNMQEDGIIDAGWLAQNATEGDMRIRGDRLDQLAFGQRAFAATPDAQLPDALLAVRSLDRYRMLMLTLDRIGVRNAAVYAAAARQAERLTSLGGQRGFTALAQFQSAIGLVARLVRVHSLLPAAAESLVSGIAAVAPTDEGRYAGAMARWLERALVPALAGSPVSDVDAQLARSLSGPPDRDAVAKTVSWEGRSYAVDLVAPEQRRLARALEKMGAPPLRLALDLEHLAARISAPSASVADVRESILVVKTIAVTLTPKDKKAAVPVPPGLDVPKSRADVAAKVVDELTQVSRPKDLKRAARAAEALLELSDDVLAEAMLSIVYALDIGSPDGTTLLGGNVSRRHDFGLAIKDGEKRARTAWAAPARVTEAGVPWHVAGSVLGLDGALASLSLRRIDSGDLPQAPVLMMPDRETFTKTLAWMNPFELTDPHRDAIVAAIGRGRSRVAAIGADAAAWDRAAEEIRMDGWRRRAGRWALIHDAPLVPSFFSLVELMYLGGPPADLPLDEWGMASDVSDACACIEAPLPGRAAIVVGRPQLGLLAAEVADINLRVAEVLGARQLPANLAPGVLAAAIQDYIDAVRPMHASDWLTLVRAAQAISDDRLDDYVAALTADGPLAPDRATSSPDRRQR